jgi:WD40 repeat protein
MISLKFDSITELPSLKFLAKKSIVNSIINKKIDWEDLNKSGILPCELLEYLNEGHTKITTNIYEIPEFIELVGHNDYIICANADKNGKYIITGSRDKTARIWNMETLKCIVTLKHDSWVVLVYINMNKYLSITVTYKNDVYFWDISDVPKIIKFMKFDYPISDITDFYKENIFIRAGQMIYCIDISTLKIVKEIKYYYLDLLLKNNIPCDFISCVRINIIDLSSNSLTTPNVTSDISYVTVLPLQKCFIICFNNGNINIYQPNGKCETIVMNYEKPIYVKSLKDGFVLLTRSIFSESLLNCYRYNMRYKVLTKIIYFYLPITYNIFGTYELLDVEIIKSLKNRYIVLRIFVPQIYFNFWVLIKTNRRIDTPQNTDILFSLSKPFITNEKKIIKIKTENIENIIRDYNRPFACNLGNGNICFSYVPFYNIYNGFPGKCCIGKLAYNLSLEQILLYNELSEHRNSNKIIDFHIKYAMSLFQMEKKTVSIFLYKFSHVLSNYIRIYDLESMSFQKFGKSFYKLNYYEVCKLIDYNYFNVCK